MSFGFLEKFQNYYLLVYRIKRDICSLGLYCEILRFLTIIGWCFEDSKRKDFFFFFVKSFVRERELRNGCREYVAGYVVVIFTLEKFIGRRGISRDLRLELNSDLLFWWRIYVWRWILMKLGEVGIVELYVSLVVESVFLMDEFFEIFVRSSKENDI